MIRVTEKREKIVLALGFFDGVHYGHQALIRKTIKLANEKNCRSGVMTFAEHPLTHIFPAYAPWLITTNDEKIRIMKDMGVDEVYINDFTDTLMKASPKEFIRDYLLQKYPVCHVVVGFNYTFGYKGEGDIQMLMELGERFGFGVTVIPPCVIDGRSVSSTFIRELISTGKVEEVPKYLGRAYGFDGTIVKGKQLGHTVGIPTANLKMRAKLILPNSGVYYTEVGLEGKMYDGLTNLGFNPTFEKHPYSIETYIYDFNARVYGEPMSLTFKAKIRDDIKFDNLDALFAQIRSDIDRIDREYRKHSENIQ